ncbi:methionyl-tRNA formyltransferase [Evansella caseinilytica]|uniref:Methionyl-tRNA formyltransferase n=1 Tax=Evansella caseinilytica TaxID=1503961 RepID=A0A1H3MC90_9BACI|nr:methionyl-tRNA formyltransferase [Evansella caseinilytica]SDY74340.1 methionyl-tRNA formyltransferase [Evansella caseinilytica]
MKVIFMGTPDFAVPILHKLASSGYDVQLVVTQPDRPKGRKQTLTPPPVKVAAEELGIPVFQPEKIKNEEEWRKVEKIKPDIIVTAAFGQILPKGLLDVPPLGCINVHASLLPKYRGGAPIHQAIIDGEKETGITIMYMVEKLDAGAILSQRAMPIEEHDTTGTMHDKLSRLGADLLLDTLPEIAAGSINAVEQEDAEATFAPNITKEKEKIDWHLSAAAVHNQVRGLAPWPVAYTTLGDKRLKIWRTEKTNRQSTQAPGTIVALSEAGIEVACGDGAVLKVLEIQPSGKKRIDVNTFIHGAGKQWRPGMKLGE